MASLSLSTASLRSSLFSPRSLRPGDFQSSLWRKNCSLSSRVDRGRCAAQMAVPMLVESMQGGMGPEAHESIIQLYHDFLFSAVKLGVPFPVDDNAAAYWAIALPAALLYCSATPGPIAGLADFVQGHFSANSPPAFRACEVEVGRQMGEGSFGVVYEGSIFKGGKKPGKQALRVVLKKSKTGVSGVDEMRNAEIHMNRRLQRTASGACAEFLGTVNVPRSQARGKLSEGIWLIWKFQGYRTLDHYMKQRDFPENIAEAVLGQKIKKSSSEATSKNAHIIQKIMQQVLTNLCDLHRSGVVHRDLKPLNLVLCEYSGCFKFIDLGACVDIRSGFNYTPDETVIDPAYAAPEHYVMPTWTPTLPPDPLCSLISPVVWFLNTPDRFDIFSAGLILMQLSVKQLRQDVGLQTFNTHFRRARYDLDVWRQRCSISSDEFAILDADGGAGWELAKAMLQPRPDRASTIWPSAGLRSSRPSAAAALRHRFIQGSPLPRPINSPIRVPDSASFPSLPSLPSAPSFPSLSSLGQLPGSPILSGSAGESTVDQRRNMQETAASTDTQRASSGFGAALSATASSAFVLATGWMALAAVNNSVHLSYDMGLWMVQTVGLSGSVCSVFFLLIKPWLEEQDLANRRMRAMQSTSVAEQFTPVELTHRNSQIYDPVMRHHSGREPGTVQFKTGLSEAVLAMEAQLVSLEASIQREQEFSMQQRERIAKVEKLLVLPSVVANASPSEGADESLSDNGAFAGKPLSEYVG